MNIIFLHLPKTAGTTFNSILEKNYQREKIVEIPFQYYKDFEFMKQRSESITGDKFLIRGHMLFGIHEFVPYGFSYLVFFRDPVSRFISQYYYIKRHQTHYLHSQVKDMSIENFVSDPLSETLFNSQTKMLASSSKVFCTESTFRKALDNLNKEEVLVGITEFFDESLIVFQNKIEQISHITYTSKNVNPVKESLRLNENTLTEISRKNKYDILLYEKARQKFNEELEEVTRMSFKLRKLRFMNGAKKRSEVLKMFLKSIIKN